MTASPSPASTPIPAGFLTVDGQPVPPYQPAPDPADEPDETFEVCPACDGSPEWPSLRPEGGSLSCRFCNRTLTWNVMRDRGPFRCSCKAAREAACPKCHGAGWVPAPDPADSPSDLETLLAPTVAAFNADPDVQRRREAAGLPPVAGERTGPLGLSEGDRIKHRVGRDETTFIRTNDAGDWLVEWDGGERNFVDPDGWVPVAEWDAEPQPVETLDDIVAELRQSRFPTIHRICDRIEAASRPDPDTITVNRHDIANMVGDYRLWLEYVGGEEERSETLARLAAAAGIPQEPTDTRPRPTREEQRAHLDEGSCGCHDSWDQCPCAEGGHPADGSCGCCPLGTGLCGPLPQEPTEGGQS